MAPEQARGEAVDARADIFSAGCGPCGDDCRVKGYAIGKRGRVCGKGYGRILRYCRKARGTGAGACCGEGALGAVPIGAGAACERSRKSRFALRARRRSTPIRVFQLLPRQRQSISMAVKRKWKRCGGSFTVPHLLALIGPSGAGKSSFLQCRAGSCDAGRMASHSLSTRATSRFSRMAQELAAGALRRR